MILIIICSPGLLCCHHPLPEAAQDAAEVREGQGHGQEGGGGCNAGHEQWGVEQRGDEEIRNIHDYYLIPLIFSSSNYNN